MKITRYIPALIIIIAVLTNSCKKDEPEIPNEEELITTLIYILTPVSGGTVKTFEFTDLDGPGGNDPDTLADMLEANTIYMGTIVLLNEQENPADTISNEVWDENQEHQFFFGTDDELDLTITYDDIDPDGNPVGISSTLTTGATSMGKLTITLRHEPDKFATGVSSGDISNAGGETDIQVEFDVVIR
jgi:hypothetical protein